MMNNTTNRMTRARMGATLMPPAKRSGILWPLSSASLLPPALPHTARSATLHTRIQLTGVTSCTRQKERDQAPKEAALYSSPKAKREMRKAKARAKVKAKESLARAKAIGKAKGRRGRTLVASVDLLMTPAISASCLGTIRQSAPNLLLSPQRPAMAAFGLSCPMKRSTSTTFWKIPWTLRSVGIVYAKSAIGQLAHLQWRHYFFRMPLSRL